MYPLSVNSQYFSILPALASVAVVPGLYRNWSCNERFSNTQSVPNRYVFNHSWKVSNEGLNKSAQYKVLGPELLLIVAEFSKF